MSTFRRVRGEEGIRENQRTPTWHEPCRKQVRETSKKEKLSWKKSAERGEYRANVPLYGYKKSKDNHFKLEIDPEAARVVKEIFDMKLSGMTLTEIASNLNDRNILPPKEYKYKSGDKRAINKNIRKTYWESGVVEAILTNEKYTGDMVLLKTFNNRITGKQEKRASDEWVTVENTHEPTLTNIENAWKNIYSEYADRKIAKEDYLEKTKEYKGKKQSLDVELTHLMAKKEQSVLESKEADVVELLIKKFCDADTLTEEMKELLIEKILVYSNNVLEIYWKADFIKYFSDTSRIIGKETGKNA